MKSYIICTEKPDIVWVSEDLIEDRFDANPFKAEYVQNEIYETEFYKIKLIEDILRHGKDLTGGATPLGANYLTEGIRFIRTQDVDYNWIETENTVFISEEDNKELKRSVLEINDILLTITGVNFGKAAPVRKECLPANISQHSVRMHFKDNIDTHYISTFLNCVYGQKQILKRSVGATRPAIDYGGIKSIKIPIPSPEIQKYIGDKVRKAEELREEAKRLIKEAEEILEKELGLEKIKPYIKKMSQKKYSWVKNIQLEDRIDGDFYKPTYNYLNKLNNISRLENFYKINKKRINRNLYGQLKYIDLSSVNSIIEPNEYSINDLPSRAQFLVENGELIVSTLKGSNKISIVPEHLKGSVCSTGFVVVNSNSYLTTEYLYLIFTNKLFSMQIGRYSTGSIMSGVNHDDFNKMYIPVISDKQTIDDITYRVSQHFRLLYQSKQLIQEARQDVEDLIEGNLDMSKIKVNN